MGALKLLDNKILRLAFANTVFDRRAMVLSSHVEYTESVLDIPSIQSVIWAHRGWARRKIFKIKVLRRPESKILRLIFANTVNASFTYTFLHLIYKQYVALNSSKTT